MSKHFFWKVSWIQVKLFSTICLGWKYPRCCQLIYKQFAKKPWVYMHSLVSGLYNKKKGKERENLQIRQKYGIIIKSIYIFICFIPIGLFKLLQRVFFALIFVRVIKSYWCMTLKIDCPESSENIKLGWRLSPF